MKIFLVPEHGEDFTSLRRTLHALHVSSSGLKDEGRNFRVYVIVDPDSAWKVNSIPTLKGVLLRPVIVKDLLA